MANYSFICGFELGHLAEMSSYTGSPTVQTTYKRSGSYALRLTSGTNATFSSRPAGGGTRTLFGAVRFYMRVLALPTTSCVIDGSYGLYLKSNGQLSIDSGLTWSTNSLSVDGQFHKISISSDGSTTSLYVDGTVWKTKVGNITASDSSQFAASDSADLVFDDVLFCSDNNAGADLPSGNVILLPAVSDNTDGTWTAGAGGASLFDAVDSIPPIGNATPTNLTQITNVNKTGNQDALLNCRTYTDGGVAAGDTINATMAICVDGEEVTTGTKIGSIRTSSNPADAGAYNFDFGDDVGALGNFPTNWKTHVGPTTSAPSVTKGNSPVVTIQKTDATTRATDACFLGVYVDYAPPVSTAEYVHGQEIPAGTIRGVQRGMIRMYR